MRVYTYILRFDSGFSPNPFHGWCTLACCKPKIRSTAAVGDWIVGLTPRALGNRLAYFMRVDEVLPFGRYFHDRRFELKKPRDFHGEPTIRRCGDNCYEPLGSGVFRQLQCHHSLEGGGEDRALKDWDLSGRFVLASRHFGYFGSDPLPLPPDLDFMVGGRGHRVNFTIPQRDRIVAFLARQPRGIHARPRHWPDADGSWVQRRRCASS